MNVRATAKFVGTSSRKVGLAADLIRGQKAQHAAVVLLQAPQRATEPVGKVLSSAIANAENNYNLSARNLTVESVLVGPGPTLKRYRPRAQGRAFPIRKRTSHITVVLSSAEETKPQRSNAKAAAAPESTERKSNKPKSSNKEAK